jgi:hypothetical protein
MERSEYIAQCWGGPEHGNLIGATVTNWPYYQHTNMYLDGPFNNPINIVVRGRYELNKESTLWRWVGPGADGDTIERMRNVPRSEAT